jgi:hypothetical protein
MEPRDFALLDRAKRGTNTVLRDDQSEIGVILEGIGACRKNGGRFGLIVTGKFSVYELEWLGEAGADIYTSDGAGADARELTLVGSACRRGDAVVAHHLRHGLESFQESGSFSFSDLKGLGRSGIYVHLSNKEKNRDFSQLGEIAHEAQNGGSRLIYYHHGPLDSRIQDLAQNGAWIHLSESSLSESSDLNLILDATELSLRAGANLIIHLETGLKITWLQEISDSGAVILFKIFPDGDRAAMRFLERKAKKRGLDYRSYYLYPNIML